jgi:hypothetical protein
MSLRRFASFRAGTESAQGQGRRSKPSAPNSARHSIGSLKNQTVEPQDGAGRAVPAAPGPEAPSRPALAVGEADVVVPRATLRQVRSQFEYLANEFTFAGDVASQVMCELGAFTMEPPWAPAAGRSASGRRCR